MVDVKEKVHPIQNRFKVVRMDRYRLDHQQQF
jgi:hypothetical protein